MRPCGDCVSRVVAVARCSLLTALKCKTQSCRSSSRCSCRPTWQTDAASHDAISDATLLVRSAHAPYTNRKRWELTVLKWYNVTFKYSISNFQLLFCFVKPPCKHSGNARQIMALWPFVFTDESMKGLLWWWWWWGWWCTQMQTCQHMLLSQIYLCKWKKLEFCPHKMHDIKTKY